jgi:voltage-gated potassium channel
MDRIRLKRIVEKSDTKSGRYFDLTIQALILYSLVTFSISTLPDLSEAVLLFLRISQIVTVTIFTIEYLLRVIVANKKLNYILSFYGLIDLFAILPFYLATAIDLRAIRILRLLRLFEIFKIARYTKAIDRFKIVYKEVKAEIIVFLAATVFLMYLGAVGIYFFENPVQPEAFKSVFHSLWWSVATLTTVGYGDIYPITVGGKFFTFILLMLGLGIVAIPAGLIASGFQQANRKGE